MNRIASLLKHGRGASFRQALWAGAAVVFAAVPAALVAQWPSYPTGDPKGADGKVDMKAPAPRAPDGHPDFSGIWAAGGGGGGGAAGGGGGRGGRGGRGGGAPGGNGGLAPGAAAAPAATAPTAAAGTTPAPAGPAPTAGPPAATFFNIAAGIPGGAPLQPWAADVLKQRMGDNMKDNPDAHCLPLGLMQLHLHPQPRKIIQTSKLIVILYEAQAGVRQIFMDGRPSPPADVQPWWYGYSIGKWDGDTLVVTTTGFRDDVWLDVNGTPLTNTGKLTERFTRPNYGTLNIEITVEDPHVYTKPYTVKVTQRIMPDTDLIEFICNENEKSDAHLVGGSYSPAKQN
jgi:hypothetical protein